VTIEVADTGPGIPEALREVIFLPHVRGPTAAGRAGLGLGLATVKRLVDAHHGLVSVRAEPGGGSVFLVELDEARPSTPTPRRLPS
jgi:signal transduction histidine kinase